MTRLSNDCSIRVYLFTNIHAYSTKIFTDYTISRELLQYKAKFSGGKL